MITADQEQQKYEKTWGNKGYRIVSPGELCIPDFLSRNPERGTLVDFGCGTGRATAILYDEGFEVTGVDIANNCVDTNIPFVQACLWEIPFQARWAYCCDVLEHIPPEHVDAVLKNMDTENCYLHIHLKEDKFGKQVGEKLHLTIQPHEWWLEKVSQYWNITDHSTTGTTSTFYGEKSCRNGDAKVTA